MFEINNFSSLSLLVLYVVHVTYALVLIINLIIN